MIDVQAVTVRRGGRLLFDNFSWQLPDPGMYLLIGGNGSGKSLVADLVSGRLKPNRGSVVIDGEPLYRIIGGYSQHIMFARAELPCADGEPLDEYLASELRLAHGSPAALRPLLRKLEEIIAAPASTQLGRLSHGQVLLAQVALAALVPARVTVLDGHLTYLDGTYCQAAANLLDHADLADRFVLFTASRLARPFPDCHAAFLLRHQLPVSLELLPAGAMLDSAPDLIGGTGALRVYFRQPVVHALTSGQHFTLINWLEDGLRIRLQGSWSDALLELQRMGVQVRAVEWEPAEAGKE